MPYYYPTQQAALAAAEQYKDMFGVQAVLEPYNGWVIKLIPRTIAVLKSPLYDLLQHVELDMGSMGLVRKRPADHARPPRLERETPRRSPAKPAAAAAPPPPPPPPPAPGGQPPATPRPAAPPPPPPPSVGK